MPADATLSLGRRILQRVFGRGQPPDALADLAANPADADLRAALRVALRKLLAEDSQAAAQVRNMLAEAAATQVTASNVVKAARSTARSSRPAQSPGASN
jgi:hypothetical protein